MKLKTLLQFNGSLGVILPKVMCKELKLHHKDLVAITFESPDRIVIKKAKYSLKA